MAVTFGRQRPGGDVLAAVLLLVGFTGIAYAMWLARGSWLGVLLPLAFVIGAFAGFRSEVREVDVEPDRLILRTFFRAYPIPRAHITHVVLTSRGVAIDVLNGARYFITPPGVDADDMYASLLDWHGRAQASS